MHDPSALQNVKGNIRFTVSIEFPIKILFYKIELAPTGIVVPMRSNFIQISYFFKEELAAVNMDGVPVFQVSVKALCHGRTCEDTKWVTPLPSLILASVL